MSCKCCKCCETKKTKCCCVTKFIHALLYLATFLLGLALGALLGSLLSSAALIIAAIAAGILLFLLPILITLLVLKKCGSVKETPCPTCGEAPSECGCSNTTSSSATNGYSYANADYYSQQ